MRALFVAGPGVGHVFPMVPLAWALRGRGHDVLVATAGPGPGRGECGAVGGRSAARMGLPRRDRCPLGLARGAVRG
jgi:hypothetical protein